MSRFQSKVKISANLVRHKDDEYYRVLDDNEMMRLKCTGRIIPEGKFVENSKYIISYYIEVA